MKRLAVSLAVLSSCVALPTHAHGIYAKAGVLGAGLGGFYRVTDAFSVRADVTTAGKFKRNFDSGGLAYSAHLDANQFGLYGDWFPFGNGFRLTGGVQLRKLQVNAQARLRDDIEVNINGTKVKVDTSQDRLTGAVKFPTAAPYLGFGWGYDNVEKGGFGFVLDVGVAFGSPKTSLTANDSLLKKIDAAAKAGSTTAAAELEGQRRKLADTAKKLKVFPQAYLGVSYRF